LALEASPACVLKDDVIGHQLHHGLDVVPVELVVEARNDIHRYLPLDEQRIGTFARG
jgi:hypothetical protein